MLTVTGLMRIRMKTPASKNAYRTFGYPITPLIFILGNLWIVVFSIKSRPVTALFGLATIGLGMILYIFFARMERSR